MRPPCRRVRPAGAAGGMTGTRAPELVPPRIAPLPSLPLFHKIEGKQGGRRRRVARRAVEGGIAVRGRSTGAGPRRPPDCGEAVRGARGAPGQRSGEGAGATLAAAGPGRGGARGRRPCRRRGGGVCRRGARGRSAGQSDRPDRGLRRPVRHHRQPGAPGAGDLDRRRLRRCSASRSGRGSRRCSRAASRPGRKRPRAGGRGSRRGSSALPTAAPSGRRSSAGPGPGRSGRRKKRISRRCWPARRHKAAAASPWSAPGREIPSC